MAAAVTADTVCMASVDVVAQEIEGELVIVPLAAGLGDADDALCALNASGKAIWQRLDGRRTLGAVVAELGEQFQAPRDVIEPDVLGFAGEMLRRGFLIAGA